MLLQHPDGKTALIRGDVDAWAGLDPMMAQAEVEDGAKLFFRKPEANTWGILNVREEFLKDHPDLVKRVLAVYEEARKYSLANYDELKRVFIAATKLPDAVVDKQLKERTELTHSKIGAPQRESILAAGLALQQAGVIKADVDVKKAVDELIDDRVRRGDELSAEPVAERGPSPRQRRGDRRLPVPACGCCSSWPCHVSCHHDRREPTPPPAQGAALRRAWRGCVRPVLGLLLPVGARGALGNRGARRAGPSGRLVPPPSVIFATFAELAQHRRIAAPCARDARRASPRASACGVVGGHARSAPSPAIRR